MSRKTIYYHDPLHDDFAPTNGHIRPKPIGADFPYEHPSPVWQALAFVVYRLIMTPQSAARAARRLFSLR